MEPTDDELVKDIRAKVRDVGKLAKQARERGISVRIHAGTSQVLDVLRELEVIAEKVMPL
jgi:hypothetical protein